MGTGSDAALHVRTLLVGLVGRRVIPILVKDDGQPMLESMDMVDHIDAQGKPLLLGPEREAISECERNILNTSPPLTMPRYPLLDLPEFATVAARDHYIVRKLKTYGDFVELRARTRELMDALMTHLEKLDGLIQSPTAINGTLSRDDIRILPLLRSAAVVNGLSFPPRTRDYFETMMSRIGFPPLPKI
ncbi:MAG: glutaredoxin 2 [Filomicrobium sp.]